MKVRVIPFLLFAACNSVGGRDAEDRGDAHQDAQDETNGAASCCCACPDGTIVRFGDASACQNYSSEQLACDADCSPYCPKPDLPSCADAPWKTFFVLAHIDSKTPTEDWGLREVFLSGLVEAVGDRRAPADMLPSGGESLTMGIGQPDESGFWLRIKTPSGIFGTVEIALPGAQKPTIGDSIVVDAWYQTMPWASYQGSFLMTRNDGERLAWVGEGGSLSDLGHLPGIELTSGNTTCLGSDDCGTWVYRGIGILAGGVAGQVGPGESTRVGTIQVTYGEYEVQTSTQFRCADWFKGRAILAITWAPTNQ